MYSILYVDDEPLLLELTKAYLKTNGNIDVDTVDSAKEALSILKDRTYDAIVSDYQMPGMDGIDFLKELRGSGDETPFIIFTGKGREEVVIEAFESGADFYLQKGGDPKAQFAELVHKIRQAVAKRDAERALEESEEKFRSIVERSPDFICQADMTGTGTYFSPSTFDILGYRPEDIVGKEFFEFMGPEDSKRVEECIASLFSGADVVNIEDMKIHRKDGTYAEIDAYVVPLRTGKEMGMQVVGRDISYRKKAEEKIREKDDLYRSLAETVPGMIYIVDHDGKILYLNKAGALKFGTAPEEIEGKSLFDVYPKEQAEGHMKAIDAVMSTGKTFYREMEEKFPSDSVWISVSLSPLVNSEGEVTGVLGVSYDVTSRKKAEEALKKSEKQYAETINSMPDAISVVDKDLKFLLVNEAFRKLAAESGFDVPDDVLGCDLKNTFSFLPSDVFDEYEEVLSKGEVITREEKVPLPDKTVYVITTKIPVLNDEKVERVLTIIHDITDERKAQSDLKDYEELMKTVFDSAQDAIFIKNTDLVYTHINSYLERLLEFTRDNVIGKTDIEIFGPSYPEIIGRSDEAVLRGESASYDVKHLFNGENFYFSVSKSPVYDGEGSIIGICGIARDITERKRTENALTMANKKLDLLSKITRHDLRNKITAIFGYCELVRDESENSFIRQLIGRQESSLEEMAKIIDFLRKYEVVDSEPARWIPLQQEVDKYISAIDPDDVTISVMLEGIEIFSDIIFVRIFSDLINNSLVHGQDVSQIKILWKRSEESAVLIYEDDGCGIPDDMKEKIFVKGFGRGTGLGLYYVREILNVLGMSIKETGEEGKGATFEIHMPMDLCRFSD